MIPEADMKVLRRSEYNLRVWREEHVDAIKYTKSS